MWLVRIWPKCRYKFTISYSTKQPLRSPTEQKSQLAIPATGAPKCRRWTVSFELTFRIARLHSLRLTLHKPLATLAQRSTLMTKMNRKRKQPSPKPTRRYKTRRHRQQMDVKAVAHKGPRITRPFTPLEELKELVSKSPSNSIASSNEAESLSKTSSSSLSKTPMSESSELKTNDGETFLTPNTPSASSTFATPKRVSFSIHASDIQTPSETSIPSPVYVSNLRGIPTNLSFRPSDREDSESTDPESPIPKKHQTPMPSPTVPSLFLKTYSKIQRLGWSLLCLCYTI